MADFPDQMAEEAGVEPTGDAFAPPDGFEDRAPHRGRYSSAVGIAQFALRENRQCGRRPMQATARRLRPLSKEGIIFLCFINH
jgi:hypothetical protein